MTANNYKGVDYSLWPMFENVEDCVLKEILLIHIFGSTGESAIYVTKEDIVFAIGVNVIGALGIGDIERTHIPIKLDILCGKFVMGFASGSTHSVAYTRDGELYSWGDNNLGKLGNGTIISRNTPGRVILPEGVKIIQAACSDRYTAAITSEYKVLHWGDTEWTSGTVQTLPIYLEFPGDPQIYDLCCGALHAAALSSDGKVFTWGCGDLGQLGQGRPSEIEITPHLVEGRLSGLRIQQIACAMVATIVLTEDGRVFAWGHNRGGSLGLGLDIETVPCPQHVQIEEPIKSISAVNMGACISAVSDNNIYKWGEGYEFPDIFYQPGYPAANEENHKLNVFAGGPTPRCLRLMDLELIQFKNNFEGSNQDFFEEDFGSLRDIGSALFNNKEYSDLVLKLSDGVIYVHKLILRTFCEHFKSMLDGSWAENGKKEIDMTRYNPQAYRAFVKYIYTGKLDRSLNGTEIIELCDIAESYIEKDLKKIAISKFSSCITIQNVADLYSAACAQSCEEIKEMCCNFVSWRLEDVVLTEGFDNLKGDLCKSLVKTAVQMKTMSDSNERSVCFNCMRAAFRSDL